MILRSIVEFAEANAAGLPSGYQPRFVTKVIQLRTDGTVRQVVSPSNESRGKRQGVMRPEPQESPTRTVGVKARPIADNVNYVLGKVREKDQAAKVEERHQAWLAQVGLVADSVSHKAVAAVQKWASSHGPSALRDNPEIAEDDELTFEVEGVYPTDLPEVRAYWGNQGESEFTGQCLISGLDGPVTDRMPSMIKGIPGGQMSGTALVSVNNAAGESYGLSAALNSPISPDAAEKLCNGLNLLINDSRGKGEKGRTLYKYSLRVGPTVYLAWRRGEQVEDFWDVFDNPQPEHVHQLIEQARSGGKAPKVDEADFYVMALSANAARIIVRDHYETTLTNVRRHIGEWFQRLQIGGTDGQPAKPVGVYRLAASLYRDASKEMPAHVPTDLLNAALRGRPLPEYILALAVKRNLAMQGPFYELNKKKHISTSRLALIKAALTSDPEDTSLMQLNPDQPNPAYHCGRMLAILESIQRVAIPGLNATLVDRNYGAACASPASIFGNLLKDATSAHLPKLRKNRPGAYFALDQRLQEAATAIGAEFPKTLTLKDQGLFSLGYYHQRANDMAEARKNKELKELAETAVAASEDNEL